MKHTHTHTHTHTKIEIHSQHNITAHQMLPSRTASTAGHHSLKQRHSSQMRKPLKWRDMTVEIFLLDSREELHCQMHYISMYIDNT